MHKLKSFILSPHNHLFTGVGIAFLSLVIDLTVVSAQQPGNAALNVFKLSEITLIDAMKKSSSEIALAKANESQAQYQRESFRQKYQWHWVTKLESGDSDEKAIASFVPTFGPTHHYQTGLRKNFSGGIGIEANLFTNQQSTTDGSIDEATRSGVAFELSIDLWRNIFGRVDRAELKDMKSVYNRAKIESEIQSHVTELELRKIYWSLVANSLQTQVTKELLKTSQQQLTDAQRRGQQYISDKGEISRYKAQVSSRKAVIKNLEYQRDLMTQTLKNQIPDMSSLAIQLSDMDMDNKYIEVFQCIAKIGTYSKVPWEYTKIDELLELVEESYGFKKIKTDRYSDLDIQLTSAVQVSGVDKGYSDSVDDFTNSSKTGYNIGLQISVPLGSADTKAKKSLQRVDYQRYLAEKNKLVGQVQAKQTQFASMVGILNDTVVALKDNDENLSISINSSRKKYRQARISLNNLISEQDQLLNTRLSAIDTKLLIIHTLYDYFQVFTEDPCEMNRIGASS